MNYKTGQQKNNVVLKMKNRMQKTRFLIHN